MSIETQTFDPAAEAAGRPRRLRMNRPSAFTGVTALVALGMGCITLVPLVYMVVSAFLDRGSIAFAIVTETLAVPGLGEVLVNTLVATVASGCCALVIGAVLAWLNERTDARMGLLTESLPMVPFLLAPIAGAVAWVLLLSPGAGYLNGLLRWAAGWFGADITQGPLDIYSWYGLVLVYTVYQVPYAFLLLSAGLRNMDPSLEEAARVCGTPFARILWRVTIPALLPSMAGAALLMVWTSLGLYSVPAVIGTGADIKVLTVLIVEQITNETPARTDLAVGLSLIMILIVACVWWAQSSLLRRGRHATVGGKAKAAVPLSLGRWRGAVRAGMLGYAVITTALPFAALALVALSGYWRPKIAWSDLNLDAIENTISGSSTSTSALKNSLAIGLTWATIGIVVASLLALAISRLPSSVGRIVDGSIKLPATLSHVVLAVGFILLFAGPPFMLGGTVFILGLAYLALYYPQGAVAADNAVSQIGRELPEASATSGASPATTFRRVFVPLMLPGMLAGWALLFVRMIGDLTASAILAGPRNQVVGRQILDIFLGGSYAQLASLATVVTMITTSVVLIAMWASRRSARWSQR
ncbi:ABC transporter permease [Rhodococcus opacus]|uniref:ABC transporter permease n=1 Tax=Rhodococcus opacus TaxID=37919 RepID=UPI00155A6E8E|nr:iron ABC transporter permease [Rhodococcus opacus]